ncbi:MAG: ABC transporter permease, partial [Rhodospirillales bacterium]|nr:ABC transporter permease [Rhodospirillales bacterium]
MTPINQRRLVNFKANRRGYISFWLFLIMFVVTIFAEFIANDKPLLINYDGGYFMPVLKAYPETTFGGDFETEAEYSDPEVIELIEEKGWVVWPLIPYSFGT